MFKIIFLDIDGVLNHEKWYSETVGNKNVGYNGNIDPFSVSLINEIIDKTDAKIIISSTWKFDFTSTCTKLYEAGLINGSIIDKTPNYQYGVRGNEIKGSIDINKIKQYVILDDDCDMLLEQKDNFIHVDSFVGVTKENVIQAIKILNNESKNSSNK